LKKKVTKKLYLTRDTLARLQNSLVGGLAARSPMGEAGVDSEGPDICYISDCNPCETTVYAGDGFGVAAANN
jgi:hypothetical protein